ncbi:MAG: hypothetical protein ACLFWL_18305 [Candidatus Brocadiia bacterium]
MPSGWHDTLEILSEQFSSRAKESCGLNHMLVEVTDKERSKLGGPTWFDGMDGDIPSGEERGRYGKWDWSVVRTLPNTNPGYREPRPDECFDEDELEGVIRDGSGVVRAVSVPMKLRTGYFCGQPSEEVEAFQSLANAAAAALSGADDLDKHVYAPQLTQIFRQPRAGVRYVFGDVPNVPGKFIAQGWQAGVAQYEDGVVIDVPIAESTPNANHWILLLHRLGWENIEGTGLRAERKAWNGDVEVSLEMLTDCEAWCPEGLVEELENISADSFYSVLGTKDSPMDVNLASAFAIRLLLSDLSLESSTNEPASQSSPVDYSGEQWNNLEIPAIQSTSYDEAGEISHPSVGIMVATETERKAVLRKMHPLKGKERVLKVPHNSNTYFLGRIGVTDVVLCMSAMGSTGRDASLTVTGEMIDAWDLALVIMAGIAMGKDAEKQDIGSVLVSERIIAYEPERIGTSSSENRGAQHMAGPVILDRFRNVVGWRFQAPDGRECSYQVGPILSGEKLIDNLEFKQDIFRRFPNAIGGEMEGAGMAAAAERKGCEWIVAKSICDWGDGSKTDDHQEFAAAASVDLIEHVLNQPHALEPLVE